MSIVKTSSVFCDGISYGRPCPAWEGESVSTATARSQAKDAGWVRVNGKDLCPGHHDAAPEPTTDGPLGFALPPDAGDHR